MSYPFSARNTENLMGPREIKATTKPGFPLGPCKTDSHLYLPRFSYPLVGRYEPTLCPNRGR